MVLFIVAARNIQTIVLTGSLFIRVHLFGYCKYIFSFIHIVISETDLDDQEFTKTLYTYRLEESFYYPTQISCCYVFMCDRSWRVNTRVGSPQNCRWLSVTLLAPVTDNNTRN